MIFKIKNNIEGETTGIIELYDDYEVAANISFTAEVEMEFTASMYNGNGEWSLEDSELIDFNINIIDSNRDIIYEENDF